MKDLDFATTAVVNLHPEVIKFIESHFSAQCWASKPNQIKYTCPFTILNDLDEERWTLVFTKHD